MIKYAKPAKSSDPVAVPSRGVDQSDETDSAGSASTSSLRAVSVSPLSSMRGQTPVTPPYHRVSKEVSPSPSSPSARFATKTKADQQAEVLHISFASLIMFVMEALAKLIFTLCWYVIYRMTM